MSKKRSKVLTGLASLIIISGLILAWGETPGIRNQIFLSAVGVMVAILGGYFLTLIDKNNA